MTTPQRESIKVDVLFVGAGVASLSAAWRLMQNVRRHNEKARAEGKPPMPEPSVLIVDKSRKTGSHILSGAILDPVALQELFPELNLQKLPFGTPVTKDRVYALSPSRKIPLPHFALPPEMKNNGGYWLVSLAEMTRWLAEKCEAAGIEIYTEFGVSELIRQDDRIIGARISDKGLNKEGRPGKSFTPGMDILAKVTVLGEGSRGYLAQQLIRDFELDQGRNPQVWALGIKELIRIPKGRISKGNVIHTFGYPLDLTTYGGAFLYAPEDDLLGIGLVTALDYRNPHLHMHDQFLLFKKHPLVASLIEGGEVIEYGAKTLPEGGWFAIPKLSVNGAVLVGDSAGMLNAMRLKGIHLAMKSGMLAADRLSAALATENFSADALDYRPDFDVSWAGKELRKARNFRPGFEHGLLPGMILTGMHMFTAGTLPPGRLRLPPDFQRLRKSGRGKPTPRIKTDQTLYLDILTDVYKSGTVHREDQPSHCRFLDPELIRKGHEDYDSPCTRFCPAQVYEAEFNEDGAFRGIRINFTNCLHCKTCEIKDPHQNIRWTLPEGGDGPLYKRM